MMLKNNYLKRYESLINHYFKQVELLVPAKLYIQNETWSFIQFFDHLYRVHHEFQQSVENYASKRIYLGGKSHINFMIMFLTFHLPLKFKIPKQVKNIAPLNDADLQKLKAQIGRLILATSLSLEPLTKDDFKKSFFKHPIFSYLSPQGSVAFLYYHCKHHNTQLKRMLKQNR